ncbi:deoxynucleoside kinase [Solwaraspora sp. WMMD1047]|uniref:deoxynucleoside kinase n=1 Tax=Solwaraspora sp. WMMD1047 TaxID=3016102 RepID=UPI002416D1AA|nr:deoxynucleoside kinase [Solwaraspora sp. WMMD1047]MDG4833784.1 deoxynucleoside kinase [Solwaraspora sp. WMMD1047]
MKGLYIAVEGPTGVGKTTLASRLAAELGATVVYDPFDANPFLPQMLAADRSDGSALRVELTFVALRVAQLRYIAGLLAAGHTVVADWALIKQPIFAATTLGPDDVARITATVRVWVDSVVRPDVLVGMSGPTPVIRQRVRRRGRAMETVITGAHLDALSAAFDAAYAVWERPLIRLDVATFDTFHRPHLRELARQVRQLSLPSEMR